MAYTTPQTSTGESPFYLLYGRDAKIPSVLDFYVPRPPAVRIRKRIVSRIKENQRDSETAH